MNKKEAQDTIDDILENLEQNADGSYTFPMERVSEAMEAIRIIQGEPNKEGLWDDPEQMLHDMKKHVAKNGPYIEMADDPVNLRLGWKCGATGKMWFTKIATFRRYAARQEEKNDLYCNEQS